MINNQYEMYAQFLIRCREVMGPFDVEKLATDENYKADFFQRVALSADDELFNMAFIINCSLNETDSVH
ncbi:hypothetical protein [Methylotenera versatilis]|uniref:hypothetical protein n=1 Tax=Methylotenera versatilis TaxID=1055487 RepID=UPI0006484626|nr:hypothetical protein [Methylotenera versatilis]